ncbi:hypothetical protein [Bacillus sp. FJAT-45037]|uniref:hypothetical protein n=1 Tax=Bacillus sp. FJAT-45037 TaxID=2011007 RepID=UPI000C250847|nr:hypothetical protein [Bacillus sp. FJAT-45037]
MDSLIFEPRKKPTHIQLNGSDQIEQLLGGPISEFTYKKDGQTYKTYCRQDAWRKHREEVAAVYGPVVLTPLSKVSLNQSDIERLVQTGLEFERWEVH